MKKREDDDENDKIIKNRRTKIDRNQNGIELTIFKMKKFNFFFFLNVIQKKRIKRKRK